MINELRSTSLSQPAGAAKPLAPFIPLSKEVDQKLTACLVNLPFQSSHSNQYLDHRPLDMAIGLGSTKALEALLLHWRGATTISYCGLYNGAALVQDPELRLELLQVLTSANKEHSRNLALSYAAGQLNDKRFLLWVLDNAGPWSKAELVVSGITAAIKHGNAEGLHLLLARYAMREGQLQELPFTTPSSKLLSSAHALWLSFLPRV